MNIVGKIIKWFLIGLTATVMILITNVAVLMVVVYYCAATMGTSVDLGSGYEYFEEEQYIAGPYRARFEGDKEYIQNLPPKILDYNYDRNHIIVKQSPKGARIDMLAFPECDSLYHFDQGYNFDYYWIIVKKEHRICGPYDYEEYKKKCIEMDVKLKFNKIKL